MKSFTSKALALAAAAACGSAAVAGTVSTTQRNFAVEAITNTTSVAIPTFVVNIGVGRTTAQDFTVIVAPAGSSTRFNGTCPVPTDAAFVTASVKRQSATECAYEIDVVNAANAGQINLSFANMIFSNHSLAAAGTNEVLTINVTDLGETARIDNTSNLTVTVASSARAVSINAVADTATVTNVDDTAGPLFGFVAESNSVAVAIADTATVAKASFTVGINSALTDANGVNVTNAIVNTVAFTVSGSFDGLVNVAGNTTVAVYGTSSNFTAGTSTANPNAALANSTLTFSVTGAQLAAAGTATPVAVSLTTARTQSLGTSRVFGVSAVVNPSSLSGASAQSLSGNSSWWTWGANAMELRSAFFNNDNTAGNLTRFFFQNTGASASYSATCYGETGVTPTYGTARNGTLVAGTTAITAADICTFSAGRRGSITFTINAPAANVKAVYQQAINGAAAGYIPLERPYAGKTF